MNARTCWSLLWCAVGLALAPPSCVILPVPPVHSGNARTNVDATTPARFLPGQTTRAEVILALGEPDAVTSNERAMAYRTEKVRAIVVVGGYATGAAAPISKDDYLVFEFDGRGRLVSSRTTSHWGHGNPEKTLGTQASPGGRPGWSGEASWRTDANARKTELGAPPKPDWLRGTLVLADDGLAFRSREDFGNAAPVLTLSYRDVTKVAEERSWPWSVLAVHTRSRGVFTFRLHGESAWRDDPRQLREALGFLGKRLPAR